MREGSKIGFTLSGPQQSPRFYPPPEKKEGSCVPTPGHERENSDPGQNTNPKN